MCGITGIIDFTGNVPPERLLKAMNEKIARRGPDGQGIHRGEYIGFGHRRLSIIDLSNNAAQPMQDDQGERWIVFNGEIYNYRQLRSELLQAGLTFKTNSDTEVILLGTKFWGTEAFLQKARGMWAFAIWDMQEKELTLSRDRLGKKPLYYAMNENKILFSSSLNSLKVTGIPLVINEDAVASFLAFGYVPANDCVYKNIQKVPPGTFLRFNLEGGKNERKYWQLNSRPNSVGHDEAAENVDQLLKEAVKDRLVADVEVGSFLSGGIDSAMVTTMMSRLQPETQTFTMKVNGWRNESERAQIIVDQVRSKHTLIEVDSSEVKILPELISAYGEPFADSSMLPTALVSRAASKHLKVALTGDGGDESFGAYKEPHQFLAFQKKSIHAGLAGYLKNVLDLRPYFMAEKGRTLDKKLMVSEAGLSGFLNLSKNIDPLTASLILGETVKKRYSGMNLMEEYLADTPDMPDWRKLMHVQFRHRLQSGYLVKVDVASMHYGLETRAPLLDHRLVEYAFSLPFETWNHKDLTKGIFSELAAKYLPDNFIKFPKHGFSIPVEEYISQQWRGVFLELIVNGVAEKMGLIKSRGIIKVMEHYKRKIPFRISTLLFSILCLEIWLRKEANEFDEESFLKGIDV